MTAPSAASRTSSAEIADGRTPHLLHGRTWVGLSAEGFLTLSTEGEGCTAAGAISRWC